METLAALRTKGVEIRNTGLAITKSEQLADWVKLRDASGRRDYSEGVRVFRLRLA
jgi:hypothetical protein